MHDFSSYFYIDDTIIQYYVIVGSENYEVYSSTLECTLKIPIVPNDSKELLIDSIETILQEIYEDIQA